MNHESSTIAAGFYKDLRLLREKYPMCYLEAWTPEDYGVATDEMTEPEWIEDVDRPDIFHITSVDWTHWHHCQTTTALENNFDANYGTNWDRLRECAFCPA